MNPWETTKTPKKIEATDLCMSDCRESAYLLIHERVRSVGYYIIYYTHTRNFARMYSFLRRQGFLKECLTFLGRLAVDFFSTILDIVSK